MKRLATSRRLAPARDTTLDRVELPGRRDNEALLERLEAVAVSAARAGGLDDDAAHFLGVAIREAAINGMIHGCPDANCSATVQVCLSPDGVLAVTVADQGPGFDPAAIPDPLAPENAARGSGRGLFLMKRFADRVSFTFPRRGGAVVRLEKALRRA
jgi:serine/threonine-protein kinase RsbW